MILGTSRAAQGLVPDVLDKLLNRSVYNYSFTLSTSPYGPVYLESIKKKLDPTVTDGVFILSVDPWSLSNKNIKKDDSDLFRENKSFLATTCWVSMKPNFEYLLENLDPVYRILLPKRKTMKLHDNGWLEITVPMDEQSVLTRTNGKLKSYEEDLDRFEVSARRIAALEETVSFLRTKGTVYLVRLPVHPGMARLEAQLMPDFEERLLPAISAATDFLDLSGYNDKLRYTDGNHLHKTSGKTVSGIIGDWIGKR